MADTSESAAELRISRVKALDERNLIAIVTYMLARYPDTFPAMLDDALARREGVPGVAQGARSPRRPGRPRWCRPSAWRRSSTFVVITRMAITGC
jgi:hypothetical protein